MILLGCIGLFVLSLAIIYIAVSIMLNNINPSLWSGVDRLACIGLTFFLSAILIVIYLTIVKNYEAMQGLQ